MTSELGIKLMAEAWNTNNETMFNTIEYFCINNDDELSEYKKHCRINGFIMNIITCSLDNFKNFAKLPFDNINDRFNCFNYLMTRSWSPYLYELLSMFDGSITQEKFEELCGFVECDKKDVNCAIFSGDITDILKVCVDV